VNYKERIEQARKAPTFGEVVKDVKRWEREHKPVDMATKLPLFQYVIEEGTGGALVPLAKQTRSKMPAVYLRPHAHDQLLSRLNYSKQLHDRLPDNLNLMAVNWLIQNERERDALLRLQDKDQCRALMTQAYSPFDTLELLESVEPFCKRAKVRLVFDNEDVFHLSLTFPNTRTKIKVGDVVERGIHISNSEVGNRSVTVAGFVFRLKCLNGMVGGGGDGGGFVRFRHTGDSDRLRDAVGAAIESTYLESTKICEQFKHAIKVRIDDPATRLQKITEDHDLTQEDFKAMLDAYVLEPDRNLYGVVNAITRHAQSKEGESQYQLQRIATRELAGS